jgi:ABC-type transport system involved in cytochrome c biogenesis permease subunit
MDPAKVELLRALGRLVRGLSTLFWALPLTVVLDVQTARTDWLGFLGDAAFVPAVLAGAILYYALRQMRDFQKQERIWHQALNRAEMFAIINAGLAPFLFWWHRFPDIPSYKICLVMLGFSGLLFLLQINLVLRRLCAMLPDEGLRDETKMFTSFNIALFLAAFAGLVVYLGLDQAQMLPRALGRIMTGDNPQGLWLFLFINLMPLAMTLANIWKIKEVIFTSIFEAEP